MWNSYQPETFVEKIRLILAQLRRPNELLYGANVMKRVYSTPSLLFLAILTVAIWSANLSDFHPQQSNKYSEFDAPTTPTPRKPAEEILEARPQGQTVEDPLKIWREEQRRQAQPQKYGDFVASAPPTATAICADGTYSFSRRKRGVCSRHGGVAQWLSR
jgi:hypothetical protein